MSFLVQRQVGPRHVQHSAYDTPEEALDAATTLMTQGAMSVHIIDPSDHVFTPHRFANQVRRPTGRRHKKPRPELDGRTGVTLGGALALGESGLADVFSA